jgi:hypothetical protein
MRAPAKKKRVSTAGEGMPESTRETSLLNQQPGLRERVEAMSDFIAWRARMPLVLIDGEQFHVLGGDQLKDRDQVMVAWINQFRPHLLKGDADHGSELE